MDIVKYSTNPIFDNKEFADMLNSIGVKAHAVLDGVILDRAAFNAVSMADIPHKLAINRKYINSAQHTEKACKYECTLVGIW